jgi:hypothetical protein
MYKLFATVAVMVTFATGLVGQANATPVSCVVADPSGTPLNVRAVPGGSILGALYNDSIVFVSDVTVANGKKWAKVIPIRSGKSGWVYLDYLADCE